MKKNLLYIALLCVNSLFGQNRIVLDATLNVAAQSIEIQQEIEYQNTSNVTIDEIFLNDWNNAFSTKNTPLALRFAEEFRTTFHFAKNDDRGFTTVTSITDKSQNSLGHERLAEHPDVIKVKLNKPIAPGNSYSITLKYIIKIPNNKFTSYGVTSNNEFNLRYWYMTPAYFDGQWHYYSHKNLDDLFIPKADVVLSLTIPRNYTATTELNLINGEQNPDYQTFYFEGKDRVNTKLFITKLPYYWNVQTDDFTIVSNIQGKNLGNNDKAIIADKVTRFITANIGQYPHQKLLVTQIDADKDPIYGLNQLPNFIRPFPEHFQYELTLLKTALNNFLENTLLVNPRKEQWLIDGMQTYFLMKYVDEQYPNMKLLGTLANIWGIRSFHAADLEFNEQYGLIYMHMARTNRDQPLTMAKDSLLKFNSNLANKYKAGVGLKYLDDYINADILERTIKTFYNNQYLTRTTPNDFRTLLESNTEKDISWFFTEYLNTRKKIDFKIKEIERLGDSIKFTVKNKRGTNVPVSLFTIKEDSVTSKQWLNNIQDKKTYTIPFNEADQLVLNYDNSIPEFNLRDNWKSLSGFFSSGKALQLRLFKDFEDPHYNQIFFMPLVEFKNIYDGLTLGAKLYNKTVLRKSFNYKITPKYGTRSKSLTGSGTIHFDQFHENSDLFHIRYGISGSYQSFAEDLFSRKLTPFVNLLFRNNEDFRSNEGQLVTIRYVDINNDEDVLNITNSDVPNYAVFNARYIYSDNNLINFKKWFADLQFSKNFGKVSLNYEYRKLFQSNRQLNIRLFGGLFLYNNNPTGSNYFNFALDRPTDYLFDYSYLGRSESSGIFSQQIIISEGGFKSKLDTPFANLWITTANFSTSIWKYIHAYGDIGLVKNKGINPQFVYDSGIRLNLVEDYFELYFPVYSNLGWEIAQPNYDQKIRFVFTADPEALLGLFRRKWY